MRIVVQTAIRRTSFYDDSTERLLFFIIIYFILYRRGEGMDCQKVGDLIYRLRKEKQLTQKELANQIGISDKTISKWERGVSQTKGY